jgi:hypothetical protein
MFCRRAIGLASILPRHRFRGTDAIVQMLDMDQAPGKELRLGFWGITAIMFIPIKNPILIRVPHAC